MPVRRWAINFIASASRGEKLAGRPLVSWEEGVLQTIRWYSDNRDRWIGRVDWLPTGAPLTIP